MMTAKNILFFPIVLLFAVQTAHSQSGITDKINADHDRAPSVAALKRTANEAALEGDEYKAMAFYGRALEYDSLDREALNGYGETAMRFGNYEKAEWAYQLMVDNKMTSPDGLQLVKLADAKVRQSKYGEARELYRRFLYIETPVGITQDVLDDAKNGLEGCNMALEAMADLDSQSPLDTLLEINTSDSEFAPYLKGDTLYYSSFHYPFEKDKYFPKRNLIKVLTATRQDDKLSNIEATSFNEENKHTANVTFNENGDVMYYTICEYTTSANVRCDIYMRKSTGKNTWGPAIKLPPHINAPGYTNTEPNIGRINGDPTEILYFVSDRPGGKGKRDIWYSRVVQDSFSQPVNLDTLNTKNNDVTPFYHKNGSGTLYFSSDGRESFGGFDVYRSRFIGGEWEEPVSLGLPFNSAGNDVYFSVSKNGKTSFFASNRNGSKKVDEYEDACCYDIFKADLEKPEMVALACDNATGEPLEGTVMQLLEFSNKGTFTAGPKMVVSGTRLSFPVQPRRKYMLIVSKPRFATDTLTFQTPSTIWKDTLFEKVCLNPIQPNLIVTVYDKETLEPIPGAKVRFSTLGQMLPSGAWATGKGGGLLADSTETKPDTNRYAYSLKFEHKYKAAATKQGYTSDATDTISTVGLPDAVTLERKLYLTRGVDFIAHTINSVSRDTLFEVTYQFFELEGGTRKEVYVNPLGTIYYKTVLNFERRYMVTASKVDYTSDTVVFTTKDLKRVDFQTIERQLRLRPLKLVDYLPITLFFDNDEPDKRTMKKTTNRDYRPTYVSYYQRKPEFLDKFGQGLDGDLFKASQDTIDQFFEKEVRRGWERLMAFSEVLYEMMERGDYIVLTLKGYASPRAASQYNMNLTSRRVSSVQNHFLIFDGGIYKKFVDSGQIVIKLEPNGESKAPKGISDNIKDEKASIYDPRACRERRLEIIGVEVKRGTHGLPVETSNLLPATTTDNQ